MVLVAKLAMDLLAMQQLVRLVMVERVAPLVKVKVTLLAVVVKALQFSYHPRISRMASYSLVQLFGLSIKQVPRLAMVLG